MVMFGVMLGDVFAILVMFLWVLWRIYLQIRINCCIFVPVKQQLKFYIMKNLNYKMKELNYKDIPFG